MRFGIGRLVATREIAAKMDNNAFFRGEVARCFRRYCECDWGEMCDEDKEENDKAVKRGDRRIFATYKTTQGKIWIITEWDRSATTILFPHEY